MIPGTRNIFFLSSEPFCLTISTVLIYLVCKSDPGMAAPTKCTKHNFVKNPNTLSLQRNKPHLIWNQSPNFILWKQHDNFLNFIISLRCSCYAKPFGIRTGDIERQLAHSTSFWPFCQLVPNIDTLNILVPVNLALLRNRLLLDI